jgi:hypothetical protein
MYHHDERTDEHPEAVRSEPVPVPPPSDETSQVDDASQVDGDRIPHQVDAEHAADSRTFDAEVDDRDGDGVPDALDRDDDTDRDADGVPDDTDAVYAERSGNPDPDAALDDRGTFDDPVVASPVEVDEDRSTNGAAYAEPAAFGAATVGAATVGAATVGGAAVGGAALAADRDAEPVVEDAGTELKPGDVEAEPVVTLMSADVAQGFRDRWRDVQLRFVDDPREAAAEAQTLAEEAVDAMVSALTNHKNELGSWQSAEAGDTEQLRVVVRRYRDLLDRLLGE